MSTSLKNKPSGFTLIETMVAITLLTVAIIAPMALASQSLGSAIYARDQITAYYLAQEAIESVRAMRDGQVLQIAKSTGGPSVDLFGSIPKNQPFRIDTLSTAAVITPCSSDPGAVCAPLQTDGNLYGYQSGWTDTHFTRTVEACYLDSAGACIIGTGTSDEVRVIVTISWQTQSVQKRTFTIASDFYRWIEDGSGT